MSSQVVDVLTLGKVGVRARTDAYLEEHAELIPVINEEVIKKLTGELSLPRGECFDVNCRFDIEDTSCYTNCHQVTFGPPGEMGVLDAPENLAEFLALAKAKDPNATFAVFFAQGQVSHTATQVVSSASGDPSVQSQERTFRHGLMGDVFMVVDPTIKKGKDPHAVQISASITFTTKESQMRADPNTIVLIHDPKNPITAEKWADAIARTR